MFERLRLWRLAAVLKRREVGPHTYTAVVELGRLRHPQAVQVLIEALQRAPGVARAAALELGRSQAEAAIGPLVEMLGRPEVSQSAARALIAFGAKAVGGLLEALKASSAQVRLRAAEVLGELRDPRALDGLIQVLQADPDYRVRAAAATALGEIGSPRALFTMVSIMKLRDETDPERQAALETLRAATRKAMQKIGDPLQTGPRNGHTIEDLIEEKEEALGDGELHPRLIGDVRLLRENELVQVLRELITASEEVSWAQLEQREPMLAPYFRTYPQRQRTAELIGRELHRRGGAALLRRLLNEHLDNYPALRNWWAEYDLLPRSSNG